MATAGDAAGGLRSAVRALGGPVLGWLHTERQGGSAEMARALLHHLHLLCGKPAAIPILLPGPACRRREEAGPRSILQVAPLSWSILFPAVVILEQVWGVQD